MAKITHKLDEWEVRVVVERSDIDKNHVVVLPNGRQAVWGNGKVGKRVRTNVKDIGLVIDPTIAAFTVVGTQAAKQPRPW